MGKLLGQNKNQEQNNGFNNLMQMLDGVSNPQDFVKNKLKNNPQANAFVSQFQSGFAGKNPKDIALQMAKQRGISEEQLMQIARKFGLK